MNDQERLDDLAQWQAEATDLLRRIIDRMNTIDALLGDLHARIDEWDVRR